MNLFENIKSPIKIIVTLLIIFLLWATAVASIAIVFSKDSKDISFANAMLLTILDQPQKDAPVHIPEALLEASLDPSSLCELDYSVILKRFQLLKDKYPSLEKLAEIIIPSDTWFLARLFVDRESLVSNYDITQDNAFGRFYGKILASIGTVQGQAEGIEILLELFYNEFHSQAQTKTMRYSAPVAKGKFSMPLKRSLTSSHQNAIDIFFTQVKNRNKNELGPDILSISPGIVVVARGDWKGGDAPETYVSGGISPRAGNGVIIYNPLEKRYYNYFHLHDVTVKKGQLVEAGQKIGRGGNTGINAKRYGHGGHLHFEIYDVLQGQWSIYKLYDLVKSLK